jgi:hypothetical protein
MRHRTTEAEQRLLVDARPVSRKGPRDGTHGAEPLDSGKQHEARILPDSNERAEEHLTTGQIHPHMMIHTLFVYERVYRPLRFYQAGGAPICLHERSICADGFVQKEPSKSHS